MTKNSKTILLFSCSLAILSASAQDSPEFVDQLLFIPTVDTAELSGNLQDVTIRLEEDGSIRLVDYKDSVELNYIDEVTAEITTTHPVQVFLRISGTFPTGCPEVGQTNSRLLDKHFAINVYYANNQWRLDPGSVSCSQAIVPFSYYYSLPVYGLESGTYTYSVNDHFSGEFQLLEDNAFSSSN